MQIYQRNLYHLESFNHMVEGQYQDSSRIYQVVLDEPEETREIPGNENAEGVCSKTEDESATENCELAKVPGITGNGNQESVSIVLGNENAELEYLIVLSETSGKSMSDA